MNIQKLNESTIFGTKNPIKVIIFFAGWTWIVQEVATGNWINKDPLKTGKKLVEFCNLNGFSVQNKQGIIPDLAQQLYY